MVVETRIENNVGYIVLNRPDRLNAFDRSSWSSLGDAVRGFCSNPSIDALVITGVGRAFSAGDDIYAMYELKDAREAGEFFDTLYSTVESIAECTKPVVCVVNGLAYGGGMESLLFCDVVIASEDALFAVPEGRLGLFPPMMITVGLGTLGFRLVRRLAITGEPITANEAKEIGLVDYVVPKDKLMDKLNEVLESIKKTSPISIRVIKEWTMPSKESLRAAIKELTLMVLTEDARRRMQDFIESRRKK